MRRAFWMLVCLLAVPAAVAAQNAQKKPDANTAQTVVLPRDTKVHLELIETLSSADRHKGDVVHLEVVSDIEVDGKVVVPAGTLAEAKVTTVRPRNPHLEGYDYVRDGYIDISDPELIVTGGRRIRLASENAAERRKTRMMETAVVVLAPVTLPLFAAAVVINLPFVAAASLDHPKDSAVPALPNTYQGKDMVYPIGKEFTRCVRDKVRITIQDKDTPSTSESANAQ